MIRIAVAEDEKQYADQLQAYIQKYADQSGEIIDVAMYTDGDELIENYKAQFDLVLLDVEMPFLDGMSTAELIRKTDQEVVIIFITNMAQYAIRGYAVDALDYVLKPVSYFAFSQRLARAISRMKKREFHYFTVPIKGGAMKLERGDLFYVESQRHNLIFHTRNGKVQFAGVMKEWEEKLTPVGFFRCNKGYLVNLEHVEGVRDGCAIVHGEALIISRPRKAAFLEVLAEYMGGRNR